MLSFVLGIVLGCGGTPMQQMLPQTRTRAGLRAEDTLGVASVVAASTAAVWQALPAVFGELGLEINFRDPAEKRVGTCFQRVRGRLGKALLSSYLDCGDLVSRPNADSYEVDLTVLTTLAVDSGGTRIATFVVGLGQSNTSAIRTWCRSKGRLEELIREMVASRLSK